MARPIWSGSITFGLVTIPVALFSATEDHTIHFNQFERDTADRIRYQRVNERTGKEVDYADIVRGHEVGDGEYVVVEPDELAAIAPGRSRSIEIGTFVDLTDIDPVFFQKTYWLAPAKDDYADSYALLVAAMAKVNRAGIATFVMRGKEYLTALRADDDVLALDTLYFADEIRDPHQLDSLPGKKKVRGKQLDMATSLIDAMSGEWKPEDYRDTYTAKVHKLIEDKRKGKEIVTEAEAPDATGVVDLMDALRRSVEGAKKSRGKSKADNKIDKASKSELDELARQLKIRGRSKMNRAELLRSVKQAS
ncbi:MAG TPA: Ku protein [Pseudonocardiaceae bacterium]|jgi:DNA end-binding protein Ku|nr:Ku protein [Pseudonocardiaceae bacterium]